MDGPAVQAHQIGWVVGSCTLQSPTRPGGLHFKSTWSPCGVHVNLCGVHVESMWSPCELEVESMWTPHGLQTGHQNITCAAYELDMNLSRIYQSICIYWHGIVQTCKFKGGHVSIVHLQESLQITPTTE